MSQRQRTIILPLIFGLGLVGGIFTAARAATVTPESVLATDPVEAPLDPDGAAYELNRDVDGHLWISDYSADQIWQVNPATAAYTIYHGIQTPSDARRDAAGYVWWGDGSEGRFGRLDPATGEASWWTTPGAGGLYGSLFDDDDDFWVMGWDVPYLYHYDVALGQLCTYTLPDDGTAEYPQYRSGAIWLADDSNGRALKLDPAADTFTLWPLPADSTPLGLSIDPAGELWFADPNNAVLGRFDPLTGHLHTYDPPSGQLQVMITSLDDEVWYSQHGDGAIGRLTPALADSVMTTINSSSGAASVSCNPVTPAATATITTSSGFMSWSTQSYPLLADSDGWRIYDLPTGAFPWGVAANDDHLWFVDTGRQVLGRIPLPPPEPVTVSACKVEDQDGDETTTDDQTVVQDWPIDLRIDSTAQGITKTTGLDGCTTWDGLDPGPAYGLQEDLPAGWSAVTAATHDFGAALRGGVYTYTFVNTQEVSVTACKVEDADGDETTTGDQTPLQHWDMDLRIDGAAQGITDTTGLDGCVTWDGLAPGPAYGVQEGASAGWLNLTSPSRDFPAAQSGDAFNHTFVNTQYVSVTACKVEDLDGQLSTTDDQNSKEDWPLFLTIDGNRQVPEQLTGAEGCVTWQELNPGTSYGVEEDLPDGWRALTGTEKAFGSALSGGAYSHTFINTQAELWFVYLPAVIK